MSTRSDRAWTAFSWFFVVALLYQLFHWIEHVAQVYQHWLLGLPAPKSHGILFFLDFEWNHFVFNTGYLLALVIILFWIIAKRAGHSNMRFTILLLLLGVLIQGYHEIEHIVKIYQHLTVACDSCPGILGKRLDGVYVHFTFNTLVLALPLSAFFTGRFHNNLLRRNSPNPLV